MNKTHTKLEYIYIFAEWSIKNDKILTRKGNGFGYLDRNVLIS